MNDGKAEDRGQDPGPEADRLARETERRLFEGLFRSRSLPMVREPARPPEEDGDASGRAPAGSGDGR